MRLALASIGMIAMVAACGPTTTKQPRNAEECRAAAAGYGKLTFESASARQQYFSKVVTGSAESDPTLRFIYLECLTSVGELPEGVTYEKTASAIPTAQRSRYGSSVLAGGSGYRTDPHKSKSPTPTVYKNPAETNSNGLELPTQYALLPGDETLWRSMSLTQQTRAMSFLASGSTIASSLQGDP